MIMLHFFATELILYRKKRGFQLFHQRLNVLKSSNRDKIPETYTSRFRHIKDRKHFDGIAWSPDEDTVVGSAKPNRRARDEPCNAYLAEADYPSPRNNCFNATLPPTSLRHGWIAGF